MVTSRRSVARNYDASRSSPPLPVRVSGYEQFVRKLPGSRSRETLTPPANFNHTHRASGIAPFAYCQCRSNTDGWIFDRPYQPSSPSSPRRAATPPRPPSNTATIFAVIANTPHFNLEIPQTCADSRALLSCLPYTDCFCLVFPWYVSHSRRCRSNSPNQAA